jgi:hypothetical protein
MTIKAFAGRLGLPTMIFVVLEEVYSIAPDGSERELVRRSQRPLFAGDRKAAHSFAKGGRLNSTQPTTMPTLATPTSQGAMWSTAKLTASSSSPRCRRDAG